MRRAHLLLLALLWACDGPPAAGGAGTSCIPAAPGAGAPSGLAPSGLAPSGVAPSGVAMYRETPQHTGQAAAGESLRVPPRLVWTAGPINVGIHSASKSSPVADETQLYVGADDERLYAFDKVSGEHRWTWHSRPCRNGIHATPAVDDERVYIGDYAGWLSAIDKRTGELAWEVPLGDSIGASPVIVGDVLTIGVEVRDPDGYVVAVDRLSGDELYRSERFGDHTHATPTYDEAGCVLFLGSNRGLFHALDAGSGEEIWRFAPRGALDPWPPFGERPEFHAQIKSTAAVAGDRVLFTSWDRRLYCLDTGSGAELWSFETGQRSMSSPTVDAAAGRVFFGSHDRRVYALDLRTGEERWSFATGERVYSSGVLVRRRDGAGQVFVVGSSDGNVYALDAATGALAWRAPVDGAVTSVPLVDDGRLYVATNGGDLLCWE